MPRKMGGNRGVRSCIMPWLPRHLVHELNIGTTDLICLPSVLQKEGFYESTDFAK